MERRNNWSYILWQVHNMSEEEKKNYPFIDQVIKEKPVDPKKRWKKIGKLALSGLVFGAAAAIAFAAVFPGAEFAFGKLDKNNTKVTLDSSEEEPETGETDPTAAVSTSSTPTVSSTPTTTPAATPVPTQEPTPEGAQSKEEQPEGITLQDYKQLHQDMLKAAEQAENAMVEVIGITSEMDYFNQGYENQSQITGVAVAENEENVYILTEARGVEGAEKIRVTFYDNTSADAEMLKKDDNTGLTVLKVPLASLSADTRTGLAPAPIGSSYMLQKGEPVLALGSPLGYSDSVAFGTVTSTANKVQLSDTEYSLITTDIEGVKDGSGILVNLDGDVVAIIDQSMANTNLTTVTGLAISQIKSLIEDMSNNVNQRYAGIRGEQVTDAISEKTGIPVGLLVVGVDADSPAMLAGIKEYDVITKMEDTSIGNIQDFHRFLAAQKADSVIHIEAMRKGVDGYSKIEFDMTVGER